MNIEAYTSPLEPEIVTVLSHCKLIDSESEEWIYWRRDGVGPAPGLYIVSWPPLITRRRFNEDTLFVGPFRSAADAQLALQQQTARAGFNRFGARTPGAGDYQFPCAVNGGPKP